MAKDAGLDVLRLGLDPMQSVDRADRVRGGAAAAEGDREQKRTQLGMKLGISELGIQTVRILTYDASAWGIAGNGRAGALVPARRAGAARRRPPAAPADGPTLNVEADPIRCWWRTSASAVRVGEPFTVVLTCAVVENETTTVVPDQSRLEPAALQLPPFEVIGGSRGPDLHSDSRRFFQYQYSLRLINEEMFGKDAHIPSVQINYNVESRVGRGEAVRGRDRTYLLPSESVRVLSLVPADATDIRDAPAWTFGDIEAQRFRARVFFVAAGVLFAAAALVIVVALLRMMRTLPSGRGGRPPAAVRPRGPARRRPRARRRPAADPAARAGPASWPAARWPRCGSPAASRSAVRSARWPRPRGVNGYEGQLVMRGGLLRGKKALVSGSATADAVARALATEAREQRPPAGPRRGAAGARPVHDGAVRARREARRHRARRVAVRQLPRRAAPEARKPLAREEVQGR